MAKYSPTILDVTKRSKAQVCFNGLELAVGLHPALWATGIYSITVTPTILAMSEYPFEAVFIIIIIILFV